MEDNENRPVTASSETGIVLFLETIVRPAYQIVFMIAFSCIATIFFVYAMASINIFEKRPSLNPIVPKELSELASSTSQVKVGLNISDFSEFDIRANRFVFDAHIWFLFDQSALSIETIEKFSFLRGSIIKKSPPDTKLIGGNYFVQHEIRVEFKADLNKKYFPFDDHRLYIEMVNKYVTPKELIFSASLSSFLMAPNLHVIGWRVIDKSVETGFSESILDTFDERKNVAQPKILFAIDFGRVDIQDIFLVFLPLFLMVFMAFFSFGCNPPQESTRMLTLAMSSMTGLLAYRFVLQNLTPKAGYFILSDCFFFLLLALVFLVFCLALVVLKKGLVTRELIIVRGIIYIFSYMILLSGTVYFLFYWPYT